MKLIRKQYASRSLARLASTFTASHRGGCGSPLVCLHGFHRQVEDLGFTAG
jgi:hypothetical protein